MANLREERKRGLEEEYFHRKEQEALEKTRQRLAVEDCERHQQDFLARCPKCGEKLEEVIFQELTVDRCIGCQGVWLDPGELQRLTSKESRGWLARLWRSTAR
jgi:hypothetical protein